MYVCMYVCMYCMYTYVRTYVCIQILITMPDLRSPSETRRRVTKACSTSCVQQWRVDISFSSRRPGGTWRGSAIGRYAFYGLHVPIDTPVERLQYEKIPQKSVADASSVQAKPSLVASAIIVDYARMCLRTSSKTNPRLTFGVFGRIARERYFLNIVSRFISYYFCL